TLLDTGEDRRTLTKAGNEHLLDTEGSQIRLFAGVVAAAEPLRACPA
ncbi:hypothetical protein EV644_1071, partial [Kribbella orskensis]